MTRDLAVCRERREFVVEVQPLIALRGTSEEYRTSIPMRERERWTRQARVLCGRCDYRGWSPEWEISSPSEPCPRVSEIPVPLGSCPSCGAKESSHG